MSVFRDSNNNYVIDDFPVSFQLVKLNFLELALTNYQLSSLIKIMILFFFFFFSVGTACKPINSLDGSHRLVVFCSVSDEDPVHP